MVAFRNDIAPEGFEFPESAGKKMIIKDIIEEEVSAKYYLSNTYLHTLRKHRTRHEKKGNGQKYMYY